MKPHPPKRALQFLRWFCREDYLEEIEGDLTEVFIKQAETSPQKAKWKFTWSVVKYFRPEFLKPLKTQQPNSFGMYKSYFKIGWRNLWKSKGYSFINIGGLATGMAVTILIGLWIWDEISFNKNFKNFDRIAQVWQFVTFDVEKSSYNSLPIPLAYELRNKYPEFERVSLSSYTREGILAIDNKQLVRSGNYVEPDFNEMMSLEMLSGSRNDLHDINTIMLSRTLAYDLFGDEEPLNHLITLNENISVKITGVYEDFPDNSDFKEVSFLAPWDLYASQDQWVKNSTHAWDENSWLIFAQLKEGKSFEAVSGKIKDIRMKLDNPPGYKPEFFLHPMCKWHLYGDFKNGVNTGGQITYVWLFGLIGIFVLLLACINFMNLATARSEKRAREVGIRKSIGSVRTQLMFQFVCESFLTAMLGFLLSLVLVQLMLPFFNDIAGKRIEVLWSNPWFWVGAVVFSLVTGLLSGSYPAFYLSSFQPVKVLKGTFRPGRWASMPRKILVVLQFTVSITLMIGIMIVFRQIEFARSRPVGYARSGLVEINMKTNQLRSHFDALRQDLLDTRAVDEMAVSLGSITSDYGGTTDVKWQGKTDGFYPLFMANKVTHEFGKTVGWKIIEGRDFSREHNLDNEAAILNEAAAKLIGFKNPTAETLMFSGKEYKIIGVIQDLVKESPFKSVKPSIFMLDYNVVNVINIRLASDLNTGEALGKVEAVFKKYNPAAPFEYYFVDQQFAGKFSDEVRIGKISGFFAILALFISCLGIFGLASFLAEQRTKEIGIRKVLGASVFNLWKMLSKDFVLLVIIAVGISIPIAYYFMNNWLQNYEYRTTPSWWIFGASALGAIMITLFTVSYQSINAALDNPVKSLRSE